MLIIIPGAGASSGNGLLSKLSSKKSAVSICEIQRGSSRSSNPVNTIHRIQVAGPIKSPSPSRNSLRSIRPTSPPSGKVASLCIAVAPIHQAIRAGTRTAVRSPQRMFRNPLVRAKNPDMQTISAYG
jgi:hypothetical protein